MSVNQPGSAAKLIFFTNDELEELVSACYAVDFNSPPLMKIAARLEAAIAAEPVEVDDDREQVGAPARQN